MQLTVRAIATYLPEALVTSAELEARHGLAAGFLDRHCGVATRPIASKAETQEAMGARAARAALAQAGLGIEDIDLLLFAAAVGRQPIPATAPLIKRELGGEDLPFAAYDVNATCLSALVALDLAALHLNAGRARRVLVVASEIASRALPWQQDPATAGLFGDGAAALILDGEPAGGIGRMWGFALETYAAGYDACTLAAGGTGIDYHADPDSFAANAFFRMDGPALYRLSRDVLPGFLARVLARVGWSVEEIDLVIPHQASPLAIAHMTRTLGFRQDIVFNVVRDMGNLVAASLPVALGEAACRGLLGPGRKVLLLGTSAGVSVGASVMET